jgi:putative tryptophan/tyrosine transport system substrate-binding protein
MRRRDFISLIGCAAAAWPLAARAQQPAKLAHIGYLGLGPASAWSSRVEALRAGLRDLGWIEGKNIVIEFRWADNVDQLPGLAAELVRMKVDVVFAGHADPIGTGHVASLPRPGGNITGLSELTTEIDAKTLEMLKEVKAAGERLGLTLHIVPAATTEKFDAAFASMAQENVGGIFVMPAPVTTSQRALLAELALKQRLATVFGAKENVVAGGLMSYGVNRDDLYRRAALYIDKILKGAKPADLPVEQPTKFELVVNLKTARALGIQIPPTLLARADEVIE